MRTIFSETKAQKSATFPALPLIAVLMAGIVGCSNFKQDNPFDSSGTSFHPPVLSNLMPDTTVLKGGIAHVHAHATAVNGTISSYEWFCDGVFMRATAVNFIDTTLSSAGQHHFVVRALDNEGVPSRDDTIMVTVCDLAPAVSGVNNPANPASKALTLSWDYSSCAQGYSVYLDTTPAATTLIASGITLNSYYPMSFLDYNKTYYWRVAGYTATGDTATSAVLSFTTPQLPVNPMTAAFPVRYGHTATVLNNAVYVIGGGYGTSTSYRSDVWASYDCINWTQKTAYASFSARLGHTSVAFNNKLWVIAGTNGSRMADVWSSSDGATWTRATSSAGFAARVWHGSAVFGNRMWVIGGTSETAYCSDVWYSYDGITWTQATSGAAFGPRTEVTVMAYNNALWVVGGYNGTSYFSDAWYSADGITWTCSNPAVFSKGRASISSFVYNNEMWLLGGMDSTSLYFSIYHSATGATWTRFFPATDFTPRWGQASVSFDNRFWLIAGDIYNSTAATYQAANDIWAFKE